MADILDRDLVIGLTPFTEPNAALLIAVMRAGGLGVLDLGRDDAAARTAMARVRRRWGGPFGVRLSAGCPITADRLPEDVDTVVLDAVRTGEALDAGRRVLAEVTSLDEGRAAVRRGAAGVIAKGTEAGGRVGETGTYVLLQRLLAELDVPVWAQGGIGPHTAAAAVAGGARGVVLDAQLALVKEAGLPEDVAAAIAAMDGSETVVAGGHRVYTRPDLPTAALTESGAPSGARDLRTQLLPIGQDGAFAGPLAARYKTAGGVIQAIRTAIGDHITSAAETTPLAPGAGIARDAGPTSGIGGKPVREAGAGSAREAETVRETDASARRGAGGLGYPVAQGPMTRVSDQAGFAAAVADGGGLPFLALALMSGEETRKLLAEAADLLGDRPWGVGILGFAPAEVREAQLAAIQEVRPPYALIAGGRPAQAATLEASGISTYLHVPSPGLLDRFVKEGARKFVFEGAECGGHIGPRSSFPLWEAQIACLLDHPDVLPEVSVLFAGGVHDPRSAAMVAAMCAPLAERGAATGVLMGTAYLFTEEAVATGAILPRYQRTALECDRTSVLETSPGHVTRCADTPYVAAFARERDRLAADGVGTQEAWERLEQLNLGRLRIAAKGLRRDGGGLTTVAEEEQAAEGMYMLGQVSTLRSEVTTVADLHEQVTAGATEVLAARAAELRGDADEPRDAADIAIVGMACVYPGAGDLERYWSNVVGGVDAVTEVPPERWDAGRYYDPAAVTDPDGTTPSKWGGFIPPVPFDALAYGIPPASLGSIEPVQLLALEVAARSLRDAGYADRPFDRERTSVIFGAEAGSGLSSAYGLRSALPAYTGGVPAELDEHLPRLTEDSFPGVLSNVIAGRIANRLDLGGSNFTVDAACASSLAALDLAAKELAAGTSDMVLCGGADLHNDLHDYLLFASVHALSPSGRCATFGAEADGIALGEGVACVALKRLADAERDGDRIYAVVKGVAGSSDGRSLGLTAPRPEGQRRALERAYAAAGVSPADVGLIEAHGTGTVVGDRTELAALTELFTEAGAEPGRCTIGSVKSQIGHTKCAAGLAGLIKTAYALYAGVRPGTLHVREPNPYWSPDTSPFTFGPGPWPAAPGERHAGVSAFGFGGTNFHAVLSGYDGADEPAHGLPDWPAEPFVVRGADDDEARREAERLARLLGESRDAGRPVRLRDLAAAYLRDAPAEPVRAVIVATDADDLTVKLDALRSGRASAGLYRAADDTNPNGPEADTAETRGAGPGGVQAGDAESSAAPEGAAAGSAETSGSGTGGAEPAGAGVVTAGGAEPGGTGTSRTGDAGPGGPGAGTAETRGAGAGSVQAGVTAGGAGVGKVAFLFPGQGSQRPGMLGGLFVAFPWLQRLLRLAGGRYAAVMHPPAAYGPDEKAAQREAITDTRMAQPTLGIAGLAMAELLGSLGIHPDMAGGHSYGELVALCRAGVFGEDDLIGLSAARARAILAAAGADPGTMAAVAASAADVRAALDQCGAGPEVVIANDNAPGQAVVSGPTEAVEKAVAALGESGLKARTVPVACAFHSPLVAGAADTFAAELAARDLRPPAFPVWSNSAAAPYPGAPDGVRALLSRQVAEPVRFVEQIEAMYAAGARVFVEAGPGRVLTGLVTKILGDRPHTVVPCDVAGENGIERLLHALAELAVAGVPVDFGALFAGRAEPRTSAAPRPAWTVDGQLVRAAGGDPVAGGLRPATEAPRTEITRMGPGMAGETMAGNDGARDAAVLEYLRVSREFVAAQRDVLLGYLGTAPVPGPVEPARPASVPGAVEVVLQGPAAEPAPPEPAVQAEPAEPPVPEPAPMGREAVVTVVLETVSARTGYPGDMLDPDLDLEADLSIDSIKRTEIIGELAERLGLDGAETDMEDVVAELARIKTIGGIAEWLGGHLAGPAEAEPDDAHAPAPGAVPITAPTAGTSAATEAGTGPGDPSRTDAPTPAGNPNVETSTDGATATGLGEPAAANGADGPGTANGADRPHTADHAGGPGTAHGSEGPGTANGTDRPGTTAASNEPSVADGAVGPGTTNGSDGASVANGASGASATVAPDGSGTASGASGPGGADASGSAEGVRAGISAGTETATGTDGAAPGGTAVAGERTGAGTATGTDGAASGGSAVAGARTEIGNAAGGGLPYGAPQRFVVETVTASCPEAGDADVLDGLRVVIVDDGRGVGLELAGLLKACGAEPELVDDASERPDGASGLVHLGALRPGAGPVLPEAFAEIRRALLDGADRLVVATATAGTFGHGTEEADAGLRGLVRAVAQEYPGAVARAVDVDPGEDPRKVAEYLLAELAGGDGRTVAGYADGTRTTPRVRRADLAGQPPGDAQPVPYGLDRDGVVLLTGGARGITAAVAIELARRTGCHIELIGRTPPPAAPEDPATAAAADLTALRGALARQAPRPPAEIDAAARRILAEREIRATLDGLRSTASSVRYHPLDVRDPDAVRALVDDIHARYGRLDGVVHGAGVLEDRLLPDKDPESFARVYSTKVDGFRTLLAAVAGAESAGSPPAGFVAAFGSVSGVFGNRGQTDYAAANDALDTLSRQWSRRLPGRVVTVDWGPWAGGGMVSPELEREYARRGVTLIEPVAGVDCLLSELAAGSGDAQVIYMCGDGTDD